MAPSRRKGTSKAAAAAAACRRWKVGDLVLAKVKGFPAWPAMVSEPEKWGFSADLKKVFVYFFGTQQIAFCNPADVETFTEEKKESLLTKCHGKGADFIRAVHEIIDSYEKLEKQEQVGIHNSNDEVTATNASKSGESLTNSGLKDEDPASMVKSCRKMSYSTRAKSNPRFSIEGVAAATPKDALHGVAMLLEEPTHDTVVMETLRPTVYALPCKLECVQVVQPKKIATWKRAPSTRRSRSSARLDPSRFQNSSLPSSYGGSCAEDAAPNSMRAGYFRKNKHIRESSAVSEGHDSDSPSFVSNGSIEENGSEIVTVDSDSFNERSTVESGYKFMQPDSVVECCEGDFELSQRLDLAVVVKKKRKPSRKRARNDTSELTARLDKEAALDIKEDKTGQILPSDVEPLNYRYSKENGDEHLPLVKRARVRMGRPSSAGEEQDTLVRTEEKFSSVPNNILWQGCTSLNCEEDSSVRNSSSIKEEADNSSLSSKCHKPQPWEVKEKQLFVCSVDGEAALPPSKRLHRALEAMSANATEDDQTSSEAPLTMKTFIKECSFPSLGDCTNMSMQGKAGSDSGAQNLNSFASNDSQDGTAEFSTSLKLSVAEESAKSLAEVAACNKLAISNSTAEHDECKDVLVSMDCAEGKDLSGPSVDTHTAKNFVIRSPQALSPTLGGKQDFLRRNQVSVRTNDDCKTPNYELSKPCKENDPLELSRMSSNPVTEVSEIPIGSPPNDTNLEDKCCETSKLWKLPSDEINQDNEKPEISKYVKSVPMDSSTTTHSPNPVKVMMAAVLGTDLSHSAISEGHLGHKVVSGIRSSSSPLDVLDSTARASPPSTSIYIMSTSDNSNSPENGRYCSPEVRLHHEKPKCAGKWSSRAEANAALTTFEATLGTLTRTKESIGRATRIAIDSAKFGISGKVMEILVRSLENESNLHRRVDLFFLVDSIAQCSRGLKGDGGIYPSAIQVALPRLLLAAAPPGSSAQENRRQCLKVLRVWQERRVLPESMIRHHIRELDSLSRLSFTGAFSRRSLRTERAFDDPIREMEGMMVDEYGSNSSFQLPGFHMPPMLKDEDEGSDSDGEGFEAVTPEHLSENLEKPERNPMAAVEKHRHFLEDVDGELEMEDVAPTCEAELSSTSNVAGVNTAHTTRHQFEQHFPLLFAPPLTKYESPSCPPQPTCTPFPLPSPPLPPSVPPLPPPPPLPPCVLPPPPPPPPCVLPPPPPPPPSVLPPPPPPPSVLPPPPPPPSVLLPLLPPPPPPPHPPVIPPLLPSIPPPLAMPDSIPNGLDPKYCMDTHTMKSELQKSVAHQSFLPRTNSAISDGVQYHAPEDRDLHGHIQSQMPDADNSCSFSCVPVPHPRIQAGNGVQKSDGASLDNKSFHLRPPHPAPSNQFSFIQADRRMPSQREIPLPSYTDRVQFVQDTDSGNFYSDHNRMKFAPRDIGPCYPERGTMSYSSRPYGGLPCEPTIPNHSWAFPWQTFSNREVMPQRQPSRCPIPVATRAPNFWLPR